MPWSESQWKAMAASYVRKYGEAEARRRLRRLKQHRKRKRASSR